MERLQISNYDVHPDFLPGDISIKQATIPLQQHLGVPAIPVVKAGDHVKKGAVIGEIPENALGARVHASIDGTVDSVGENVIIKQ